jgi:hypothetical protein
MMFLLSSQVLFVTFQKLVYDYHVQARPDGWPASASTAESQTTGAAVAG